VLTRSASLRRAVARCPELLRPRVTLSSTRWGWRAKPLSHSTTTQQHTTRHGARRPPRRRPMRRSRRRCGATCSTSGGGVGRRPAPGGRRHQVHSKRGAARPGSYSYRRPRQPLASRGAARPRGPGYGAAVLASGVAARSAARAVRPHRPTAERLGGVRHGRRTLTALHAASIWPEGQPRGDRPGLKAWPRVADQAHNASRPERRPLRPRKRALLLRPRLRPWNPRGPFSARQRLAHRTCQAPRHPSIRACESRD
jgi:hypothetical protein